MTPHAEILSVIAAEFPEWVPRNEHDRTLSRHKTQPWYEWMYENAADVVWCSDYEAHLAIREAAWGVVRWWCGQVGSAMMTYPQRHGQDIIQFSLANGKRTTLGSGPTDADALLAALKYIAGEIAKESGQ
jgi:hypothetical protein